jgi:hypothetical protein
MPDEGRVATDYDRATDYGVTALGHVEQPLDAQGDAATGKDRKAPQKAREKRAKGDVGRSGSVSTQNAFMHFYVAPDLGGGGFSLEEFFKFILVGRTGNINEVDDGAITEARASGHFVERWFGIGVHLEDDPDTAAAELKASLRVEGALVIYYGHSLLTRADPPKAVGLDPKGSLKRSDQISKSRLTGMIRGGRQRSSLPEPAVRARASAACAATPSWWPYNRRN